MIELIRTADLTLEVCYDPDGVTLALIDRLGLYIPDPNAGGTTAMLELDYELACELRDLLIDIINKWDTRSTNRFIP